MLSRIPGGNSQAMLSWLFFTVLIAQCSLQAVSPHPNCSVIQDWNYLPGCCVSHAVSLPLCSLQALLSFSVQSERDAAEVRLIFALHSAMQASPRAVPTACSSQHTHTHICFYDQENETAELSPGGISTTGLKCCCQPRYVEA